MQGTRRGLVGKRHNRRGDNFNAGRKLAIFRFTVGCPLCSTLPVPRLREQGFTAWIGPSGQIVTYPLQHNFAAVVRRNDWLIESWSEAGTVEECRNDFTDWHEDVLGIIDAIQTPYKWALIGRPPLRHCSVGRVTLLGDAFHPTLPILEGTNMAIEDSLILARCVEASTSVVETLRRYEAARLNRTSRIVKTAFERLVRTPGELADPNLAEAFMERLFASGSGDPLDWIHQYDAVSAPV